MCLNRKKQKFCREWRNFKIEIFFIRDDGIEVPCGKPVDTECQDTTLIYNEFIVYNLEQIRERFLVEFNYQYNFEL